MIDPIETTMLRARVWLLMEQPFYGQIITQLENREVAWCDTAATDGRHIFYSREFIKALTEKELIFLYAHEVLHVVLHHVFRRGDREQSYWNQALDYIVNFILVRDKVGEMPKGGLYNPSFTDDFSAEELYDLLVETDHNSGGQKSFDRHLDGNGDEAGDGEPQYSEAEQGELQEAMQNMVLQAAKTVGQLPGGLQRLIDRLTKPKVNWRQMLDAVLRSTIKFDNTYMRLSRRTWSCGVILPGQDVMEKVKATVWMDASGSTSQEMVTDFLSECQGIMKTFRDFELTVGTFDTKVYNVQTFTPHNAGQIEQYRKNFTGGGGTAPSCCWNHMKAQKMQPHRVILFGDGHFGGDWGDPKFAETLFVIHSNPETTAPHGRTVHYGEK